VIHQCAEQAGFRWAMPDVINRRVWSGSADGKDRPVRDVLQELARQTGLTVESSHGIAVIHVPDEAKRKELVARLADGDSRARRQALVELGWLPDARGWPELARAAAGHDVETALAAAQALRRLEGEKTLDWRLHGVSHEDPEFVPMTQAVVPWQVPLGVAFPEAVPLEAVERLAGSSYVPLREAAARLTACHRDKGKPIAQKLADDASPIVRAAAERTLVAWAEVTKGPAAARPADGQKPWWELPPPDLKRNGSIRHEPTPMPRNSRTTGETATAAQNPQASCCLRSPAHVALRGGRQAPLLAGQDSRCRTTALARTTAPWLL
jgi:hypothetical protein